MPYEHHTSCFKVVCASVVALVPKCHSQWGKAICVSRLWKFTLTIFLSFNPCRANAHSIIFLLWDDVHYKHRIWSCFNAIIFWCQNYIFSPKDRKIFWSLVFYILLYHVHYSLNTLIPWLALGPIVIVSGGLVFLELNEEALLCANQPLTLNTTTNTQCYDEFRGFYVLPRN